MADSGMKAIILNPPGYKHMVSPHVPDKRSAGFDMALMTTYSRCNDPSRVATRAVEAEVTPELARELLAADLDLLLRTMPPPPTYHWTDEEGEEQMVDFGEFEMRESDVKRCRDRIEAIAKRCK